MSSTNRGSERRTGDAYYTPDALARVLVGLLPIAAGDTVLEPSVGGGAFVRSLSDVHSVGIDIDPNAAGFSACNEAHVADFAGCPRRANWIVGNPPFQAAEAHVRHALDLAPNVAMLLRLAFLETAGRLPFWRSFPAHRVWVLAERPSFTGGATDSCAYGWFWWRRPHAGPTVLEVLSWR